MLTAETELSLQHSNSSCWVLFSTWTYLPDLLASFPLEGLCNSLPLCSLSSEELWDRLAHLVCKPCWDFCQFWTLPYGGVSILVLPRRICQSFICGWKKRTQTFSHPVLSLTYFSTYSPGGCQTQSSLLSFQLSLSMIYILLGFMAKKIPSFDEFCSNANLADEFSLWGNPPVVLFKYLTVRLGPLLLPRQE